MALWVEKNHGEDSPRFITEKIEELALTGEAGGVDLWRGVAAKLDQLTTSDTAN